MAYGAPELHNIYPIKFLAIDSFSFQIIQGITEGVSTFLVQNPCIFLVDEVVVQFD